MIMKKGGDDGEKIKKGAKRLLNFSD
ncbi:hypothetical protein SKA34_02389 [Photobacterium sp. SKA34]|nr:hypothetical protein SKA34_02389 [Photobacterium sp. SKA34]